MIVSILGCLCSTTITTLVPETSPEMTLVSAILGAAIPAFVTTAGRQRPLRIAMTVLATVCALGFTYAGALVVSPVIHEEILPGSAVFSEQPDNEDPPRKVTPPIAVTPGKLDCHPGCAPTVTIENVSAEPVVIENIDFTGPNSNDFEPLSQCEEPIDQGEKCTFDVLFDPADPKYDSHASLEISYGASDPIVVPTVSHGTHDNSSSTKPSDPPPDLPDLRIDNVTCAHLPTSTPTQGGSLLVNVQLSADDPADQLPDTTTVTATQDGGQSENDKTTPDGTASITLPIRRGEYGEVHEIAIVVDPDDEIDENNEKNNIIGVNVVLPDDPNVKTGLNCGT